MNANATHDQTTARMVCLAVLTVVAVLAISGCNRSEDGKTVGQKVDVAIEKSKTIAAELKVKTERVVENAGVALKEGAQKAEVSSKGIANKAEDKFDDLSITAAVKGGLAKDPDLSAFKIDVSTANGAVSLRGSAPTTSAKVRATAIAKSEKGVLSVDNQLVVATH